MTEATANSFGSDPVAARKMPSYWTFVFVTTVAVLFYQAIATELFPTTDERWTAWGNWFSSWFSSDELDPTIRPMPGWWAGLVSFLRIDEWSAIPSRWWPEWEIPAEEWLTTRIEWLKSDATIFGVAFKDITRAIGEGLKAPVKWAEYVLYRGHANLPWFWLALILGSVVAYFSTLRNAVIAALVFLLPVLLALFFGDAAPEAITSLPKSLSAGLKDIGAKALYGPIPWVAIAAGVVLLGHWIGGWRLALLCAATMLYLAVFNVWKDTMSGKTRCAR